MQLSSDHLRMMLLWELGLRKLAKMLILGLPLLLWVINHPLFLIQESQLFSQPWWIYSRLTSYLANRVKFQTLHDSWHRMPATRISCQGRVICWTFRTKMPTFSEFPVFLFRALTLYTLSNSVLRKIGGASFGVQWLRITCQCRGHQFDPWSRKVPHAIGRLSPWATATEAQTPRAHALQQEKPRKGETHTPQLEGGPHSLQTEKAKKTQHSQKLKNKTLKKMYWLIFGWVGFPCFSAAFSSCGEWGLLFPVLPGLLTAMDSLVSEHRL